MKVVFCRRSTIKQNCFWPFFFNILVYFQHTFHICLLRFAWNLVNLLKVICQIATWFQLPRIVLKDKTHNSYLSTSASSLLSYPTIMNCWSSRGGFTLIVSDVALTGYLEAGATKWLLFLNTKYEILWSVILSRILCSNCAPCQHSPTHAQKYQHQGNAVWQSLPQIDSHYPRIWLS